MQNKHGFNFLRKVWHVLGLIIPISLYLDLFSSFGGYQNGTRAFLVVYLGLFLFGLVFLESLRLSIPSFESFFFRYFGFLMKEEERNRFNGTVPYFLANFLVVLFFSAEIAVLSILFLVIGDPIAAYVGSKYGKNRFYNGKSREGVFGFVTGAFTVSVLVLLLLSFRDPNHIFSIYKADSIDWIPILATFLAVLVSCLTEFFSSTTAKGLIDDNLLIPLAGAITLAISMQALTGLGFEEFFFSPNKLFWKITI
ncbi:dolichol kinase [Leptospira ryugenii]|uniref:Dolichol kinase n=1 Tax=Leptospira ryugenii TaxID=1917863 RepID=A0A2P2DWU0_9LEPT|nr:dolichol kinase [Leptospira ryugenii]GBF49101.1 dolichol kinase [Leptospira ryugenii]